MEKEQFIEQHKINNDEKNSILKKILDLELDALENKITAEKKLTIVIKSPIFQKVEELVFNDIKQNLFFSDCYYKSKLGLRPTLDSIKKLQNFAIQHILDWGQSSEESEYSKNVLKLYEIYQAELEAEIKRREEECIAEKRKKAEHEQREKEKRHFENKRKRQESKERKKARKIEAIEAAKKYESHSYSNLITNLLFIFVPIFLLFLLFFVIKFVLNILIPLLPFYIPVLALVVLGLGFIFFIVFKFMC